MSWDNAYKQLLKELGHEPTIHEVQEKMLKMAQSKLENETINL